MIQFYLTIALVVAALLYMGHKALKTCDISYEIIDLDKRMDKLEADILECLKLVKEDMDEMRRTK